MSPSNAIHSTGAAQNSFDLLRYRFEPFSHVLQYAPPHLFICALHIFALLTGEGIG